MSIPTIAREVRQLIRESDDRDEQIRRALAELRTIRMPDLRDPIREPLPIRPRRLRRILVAASAVIVLTGTAIGFATRADAAPGQCGQGYAFGSGGGFCDGPPAPDGTWLHCETVYVLGFGGTNCFRVRPVPVSVDPRGWVPA